MMSSHISFPRKEHLEKVLHIFSYLKKHQNNEMVFDTSDPVFDEAKFELKYWASSDCCHVQGQ